MVYPPNCLLLSSVTPYSNSIRYDEKGHPIQYLESVLQRRERLAFLKKREWARRMAMWIDQTAGVNSTPRWNTDLFRIPAPIEYDDNEPYIIYSSSPRAYVSPPPSPVVTIPPPSTRLTTRTSRHLRHRRRKSSLTSISELPEED